MSLSRKLAAPRRHAAPALLAMLTLPQLICACVALGVLALLFTGHPLFALWIAVQLLAWMLVAGGTMRE